VRKALGTLPWVEHDNIETEIKSREVRFNLKDKKAWNEEELKKAFTAQGFKEVTVKSLQQ
jgi:hypothetical protein